MFTDLKTASRRSNERNLICEYYNTALTRVGTCTMSADNPLDLSLKTAVFISVPVFSLQRESLL